MNVVFSNQYGHGEEGGRQHADALSPTPDSASVRRQLDRILSDDLFHRSKRYSDFLRYVVECTLEGKLDDLRERTIGIEVFGRDQDYDVIVDPTVRVVNAEVRKRLSAYYKAPNREKELIIHVPLGGYVAEFSYPQQIPASSQADVDLEPTPESVSPLTVELEALTPLPSAGVANRRRIWGRLAVLSLVVLLLAGFGLYRFVLRVPVINQFWQPLTAKTSYISLYLGSDTSPVTMGFKGNALVPSPGYGDCCDNVSMIDVRVAQGAAVYLRSKGVDSQIRAASGTRFSDLATGPALLIGFHNVWLQQLGGKLPYHFHPEENGKKWIEDGQNPTSRQWMIDMAIPSEQIEWDYGLVSRIQDPSTGHWWIGIAGLTGAATLRAQEFLVDKAAMEELRSRLPRGWNQKNLQLVIGTRIVKQTPGNVEVVAIRSW